MAQKGYIKNSVTADLGAPELAAIFKGLLPTNGIINLWDDLACARINDNLVRLSPGVYNLSGYLLGVMQGTTADLAVDSGTAGYNRIDLVVAEFVRNGGGAGVDTLQFKIVKGTSTTGTPADPTLTADDINVEANTTRQEALYRLTITGTTMAAPELMASVLDNLASIVTMLALKAPLASPALTGTPTAPTATGSTNTTQIATMAAVHAAIYADVGLANAALVKLAINAPGSAPIYACRAWVNCVGVGGTINGSGNVSSVAHDAQGVWTVNFATALPDGNYAIVGSTRYDGTVLTLGQYQTTKSTTQVKIIVRNNSGTATNPDQMSIAIFR